METEHKNRVVFFSRDDMSSGINLQNAERVLKTLDIETLSDVNDLLEIYHIKLYFDNKLFLLAWDEDTKATFIKQVAEIEPELKKLFISIDDAIILELINKLDFNYKKTFWKLISYYQTFKRIDKNVFWEILKSNSFQLGYILQQKAIVDHFHQEIRTFLMHYPKTAELLLSTYEEQSEFGSPHYNFPKNLSLQDKEEIISKYIDSDANLNYIRLIEKSRDSNLLKISAKTRLKAKRRAQQLTEIFFSSDDRYETGVEVTLKREQESPVLYSNEGLILKVSYSAEYLDQKTTTTSLFMLFKGLFEYIDGEGIITLVSKQNELNSLERFGLRSKNEYLIGLAFANKSQLSHLQLLILDHYLKAKDNSIEKLILSFVEDILVKHFQLVNLQFTIPSPNSTFLEKIRVLAPELESLMKQYHFFKEEGNIDLELIRLDSNPVNFSDVKSLIYKKYGYSKHDKISFLKYHFFSSQSMLYYIEPFYDKYSNLFSLLINEEVKLNYFKQYQSNIIRQLIEEEYLRLDDDNIVKLNKEILISVIGVLYENEVISYWHHPSEVRKVIDEMENFGWLTFGNTLLSEPEISYFNFYLNKKEFSNGLDIRNKYLHGTNNASENEHQHEYYILLKLIILVLLKISDDLAIKKLSETQII